MGVTDEPDRSPTRIDDPPRRRAPHRHPGLLALIFVGGVLGTAARAALETASPAAPAGIPWATLAINVVGSLLLGALLELLARTGPDIGWRRGARLTLGTGVLGGFTTYSTFAVETVQRMTPDALFIGLAYAFGSIVLGVAAAALGYTGVRRVTAHRCSRLDSEAGR
ncbi:fluoride efflux transporter FluC [Terrabacter sp. BE26]|uniref:fluoride efflux transporter FluC n=1 Tax=Terrabacter sp. BE26 TaxID=2898152 RepID=UPI0035BE9C72